MPNPKEIASVSANGQSYDIWQSIEISRDVGMGVSLMRLAVAENVPTNGSASARFGEPGPGWPALRLAPGMPAQGYLGGVLAISGYVTVRQAFCNAAMHGVEITVTSHTQDVVSSTVDASPGQYIGYTLQQIANAVAGKVGVNFAILASPAGADKPFSRVSEHFGETRFAFIERLCRMRNLHLSDDENGNLLAFRGGGSSGVAQLIEGQNILSARIVMQDTDTVNQATVSGENVAGSASGVWGDAARDPSATAFNPNFSRYRPLSIQAEQPGDAQDMAMRANLEIATDLSTMVDLEVVVPGWFMDDGSLWITHVRDSLTVYSPMLVPNDSITLSLKGVSHRQSDDEGTVTALRLCLPNALGNDAQVTATSGNNSASAFPPKMGNAMPN